MSVKVDITQICDRCKDKRSLTRVDDAENGGWRLLKADKHICPSCIYVILDN